MINKKLTFIMIISIIFFSTTFCACQAKDSVANKVEYQITNIKIFKDTPAWELALAVKSQNVSKINKIAKENAKLLNYQDPKYGATLLLWAVGTEKYKSAEALLKCGADPDIASKSEGETPLFVAAGYSWVDNLAKKDPKYVTLLLHYGADPNKNYIGTEYNIIDSGRSPLMNSISTGLEKTKALVEAGADINYKTKTGETAAIVSLMENGFTEYAYYLIVEKKAKVSEPYLSNMIVGDDDPNKLFFPVEILRYWITDLNSKEYKLKMEIVEEILRQGVNYWETKIPERILKEIKVEYPDSWEEYIKKY